MSRVIGIVSACIGGVNQFFSHCMNYSLEKYHSKTPELVLHQQPLQKYLEAIDAKDALQSLLIQSIDHLLAAGAEFCVIPNNTLQTVVNDLDSKVALPILHLTNVIGNTCSSLEYRKIFLLGTTALIRSSVYQNVLDGLDIQTRVLSNEYQQQLNQLILTATTSPQKQMDVPEALNNAIIEVANESDACLLACSDLVKIYYESLPCPTIDPMKEYAYAAVNYALKE